MLKLFFDKDRWQDHYSGESLVSLTNGFRKTGYSHVTELCSLYHTKNNSKVGSSLKPKFVKCSRRKQGISFMALGCQLFLGDIKNTKKQK